MTLSVMRAGGTKRQGYHENLLRKHNGKGSIFLFQTQNSENIDLKRRTIIKPQTRPLV